MIRGNDSNYGLGNTDELDPHTQFKDLRFWRRWDKKTADRCYQPLHEPHPQAIAVAARLGKGEAVIIDDNGHIAAAGPADRYANMADLAFQEGVLDNRPGVGTLQKSTRAALALL